jgi:hypothetical protein
MTVDRFREPMTSIILVVLFMCLFSNFPSSRYFILSNIDNPLTAIGPAQAGTITVTGYCWYHFNTTLLLPITSARVEIYDEETTGTVFLGWNYTDYNGYFTFGPISNNDELGEDGLDIIVIVNARSSAARVITPTGGVYSAQSQTFWNCSDGPFFRNFVTPYDQRGAWWIFSYHFGLTRGWYYLLSTVGYNASTATCRWPYETGPHYHPGGEIHLPDWACWWSDTILHEYGHHVMYRLYGYIPPSIEEHYMETKSNSTTAWTEGWAHFFPLAVYNKPTRIVGINATHGVEYNLEAPHWCSPGWDDGDEVEGRVAGALWDIFDSQNDSAPWYYDRLSDGFQRIWNIMHTTPCNTFRAFWQAWNATFYAHPKQNVSQLQDWNRTLTAIFQNSIDYRGPGDVNVDGIVDIEDIYYAAIRFGVEKGQPTWDYLADLNHDDIIDIADVYIASLNQGKTYDC